jgi:DNA-binding NtrC family response regulator
MTGALGRAPVRNELGPDPGAALQAAREEPHAVVFVLREDELGELEACRELIVDRGAKYAAKPLAPLVLGQSRIPLIRGNYSSPGQLLRSIRALLERARTERNVYLVSADPVTFDALWARTEGPAQPGSGAGGSLRPVQAPATPGAHPRASRAALFELLPELPVPPEVHGRFIGGSAEARLVVQLTLRAARQDHPVLILGDTGTGKEVVARLIHDLSARRLQSFTPVNCGAIPRELLESELFGYEKGAHSTATARRTGLWQRADGGTLFLDEIADLSLDHQVKILRALDQGEIRPVGGGPELKVNTRIIAATNRNLFGMIQQGEFREDLYYRLRSFMIHTPALRDHPADIPSLAAHFWRDLTQNPAAELPAPVLDELRRYTWPGNAREMRMVLASLFALFGAERLEGRHLRAVFAFEGQATGGRALSPGPGDLDSHRVECLRQLRRADEVLRAAEVALRPLTRPGAGISPADAVPLAETLEHRFSELELLCFQPALFHGDASFEAVRTVNDRLGHAAVLLRQGDLPEARAHCAELDREFTQVRGILFREIEKVLSPAR